MLRYGLLSVLILGLVACAPAAPPRPAGPTIDGLAFENATRDDLHEVQLRVPAIRGMVACGYIPGGASCSTTFPVRQYQGNAIVVSWQQRGRQWETRPMVLPLPKVPAGTHLRAVVTILDGGDYDARLVPVTR